MEIIRRYAKLAAGIVAAAAGLAGLFMWGYEVGQGNTAASVGTAVAERALAECQQEAVQLRSELRTKVREVSELGGSLTTRNQEVGTLRESVAILTTDVVAKDREVNELKGNLATKNQEVGTLRQSVSALTNDVATKEREVNELKGALATKNQEVGTLRQSVSTLTNDVAAKNREIGELNGTLATRNEEVGRYRAQLDWVSRTFGGILSDQVKLAAIDEFSATPRTGWVLYGEPCHNAVKHRHPTMHNRQFNADDGPADKAPLAGETVTARVFAVVWPGSPKLDDKDKYIFYGGETYPPEETALGVLVPGQRVRVMRVMDIQYGPTFIEYELNPET